MMSNDKTNDEFCTVGSQPTADKSFDELASELALGLSEELVESHEFNIERLREDICTVIEDVESTVLLHSDSLSNSFAEIAEIGRSLTALNHRVDCLARQLKAIEG